MLNCTGADFSDSSSERSYLSSVSPALGVSTFDCRFSVGVLLSVAVVVIGCGPGAATGLLKLLSRRADR